MSAAARPSTPNPLREIRDRYRAAEQAESGANRDRYVEALKSFLSTTERNADAIVGAAAEVAPMVDEAAMAFYRASMPELARQAVDLGLRLSPAHPSLLHHKALVLLALNEDLPTAVRLVEQALATLPHDKGLWATKGDALRLLGKNSEAAQAYLQAQRADAASTQYVDKALKLVPGDPEALRLKVDLARAGGDLKALVACDALLKESPDDLALLRIRAELLAALGKPAEALAPLTRVREKLPDDPALSLLYAQVLSKLGRGDEIGPIASAIVKTDRPVDGPTLEAVARLAATTHPEIALAARDRLRQNEPRNVQNLHDLRVLATRMGRTEEALAACRSILLVSAENLEAMRGVAELEAASNHPDQALEAYRAIAKGHPQAVGELSKALEYACETSRPEAVREFAGAILAVEPKDTRARLELARAYAAAGDVTRAAQAYDQLIAHHPHELSYLVEKKDVLAQANDRASLAPVLDELFRLDPTRTDIAIERGNLYLASAYDLREGSSDREKAARAALVSYERASTDPAAEDVCRLGIARASRLVEDRERALKAYAEFLARPENLERHDIRRELAQTLQESGRYAEAEAEYEKAIAGGLEDPDLFWGAAEVYAHLGKDVPALRLLDLLLTKDPTNPLYLRRAGQLLLHAGHREEALKALQEAVKTATDDPHAYFDVAEALRAQGAYADAISYYRRGLELEPADRHGRLALAETLLLAGLYPEVVSLVDPLLKEDPNDLAAWKTRSDACRAIGRTSEVLYSLQAILLLEPDDGSALLEMYQLRRASGEKKEALDALTRLLRSSAPEAQDPTLQLERGDLAAELGLPEEANTAYERAGAIDPAFRIEVALRRARLRLGAGRPDLALEMLDEGLKAVADGTPPSVGALLLRAEILSALERPAEARTVYEEVRKREPRSPVAVAGIGHSMVGEGRHADAAAFLREVLPQLPPQEALYLELAEAESGLGHLDLAAAAVSQGVQALPKSVPLWTRLAGIAIARQLWGDAQNAIAHALALTPTSVDLLSRAGFVALRLEHPNEAIAFYERATEAEPGNKQAWTSHGLALLAAGRPADGQVSFDRALSIDSDFTAAKDGKKVATQRTRDAQIQRYGKEALLLEAKLHRPVAKNDLFVSLHVPFEFLGPVLSAIGQTPKLDLDRQEANVVRDLESASYQLILAALEHRPPGLERRGLSLADVASLAPANYTLDQVQRLFGYLRAVLQADLRPENLSLAPDVEDLARRALALPEEQRTLFQLVRNLRVGIYKARLIKVVEEVGSTVRAPTPSLDLGAYSPEFRAAPGSSEGDRFFAADGKGPKAGAAAAPGGTASGRAGHGGAAASAAGSGPRCVGCGGIASSVHVCGAPLCQTCVGQFPHCSKCGQPVPAASLRPIRVVAREPHPAQAPAAAAPAEAHAAARRPRPPTTEGGRPAAHEATARGDHHAETSGDHASRAAKGDRPRASGNRAPDEEGEDAEEAPARGSRAEPESPPAEPPPRPRREKVDNEPRL